MNEPRDTSSRVGLLASPCGVDVIVVAHNAGALLASSVVSAAEQVGAEHVWVIDAESIDGSINALRTSAKTANVHIFAVPNAGFSASNNRGIEATSAEYVMLLNPDAVLEPGALVALTATAQRNPSCGVVGARVLNPDLTAQANAFGRYPTLMRTLALHCARLVLRIVGLSVVPSTPAQTVSTDWVTGAAMLVRRSAIDDVGPMDEDFFLYYEDMEWCHRMRDRGWEVLLEPSAVVVHHLGGASAPSGVVEKAYRESFYRYCDLYGLWGLKAMSRLGLAARSVFGRL